MKFESWIKHNNNLPESIDINQLWRNKDDESRKFICHDCGSKDFKLFMANDSLWQKHGSGDNTLCQKCLEKRLKRKMTEKDLEQYKYSPINSNVFKFKEWLISEITDEIAEKMNAVKHRNLNGVFGDKDRIIIPFGIDPSAKYLVNFLNDNHEYDYNTGMIKAEKNQNIKLARLVDKLELPEQVINWAKKQPDLYKSLRTAKEILDASKSSNSEYSVVITRNPIDIVRMADFSTLPNQQGGKSCHAPSGSHFSNAIEEAEKNAGAVAFVVKTKDLKDINTSENEIFQDPERQIPGIVPVSRIRIRRFVDTEGKNDVAVPEMSVYGKSMPGFFYTLKNFLREKQGIEGELDPNEFEHAGGSYLDTKKEKLFKNFFDDEGDYVEKEGGFEEITDDEENLENLNQDVARRVRESKNELPQGIDINYEIITYEAKVNFYANFSYEKIISLQDVPENSYFRSTDKTNTWHKFPQEFISALAKELNPDKGTQTIDSHYTPSSFIIKNNEKENTVHIKINFICKPNYSYYHPDFSGIDGFITTLVTELHDKFFIEKTITEKLEEDNYINPHPISYYLNRKNLEQVESNYKKLLVTHLNRESLEGYPHQKPYFTKFHSTILIDNRPINQNKMTIFGIQETPSEAFEKCTNSERSDYSARNYTPTDAFFIKACNNYHKWNKDNNLLPDLVKIAKSIYPSFESSFEDNTTMEKLKFVKTENTIFSTKFELNFGVLLNQISDPKITKFLFDFFSFYDKNKEKIDVEFSKNFKRNITKPINSFIWS